jgi:hypothetical protein
MTAMRGDVLNRVRKLPKPSKAAEALQPLFEAVSNALHAIEDHWQAAANDRGRIAVTITNLRDPSRFQAVITDNGIGLNEKRYQAFCTTDTDFKVNRGGKGVGRLLWLDAFVRVRIASIYNENGTSFARSFTFQLDAADQIVDEQHEQLPTIEPSGTTVTLSGLRAGAYDLKFPKQSPRVLRHFGSHFLSDFILGKSPNIALSVDAATASFPEDVRELLISDRGAEDIETQEFGTLNLASFVLKKEASSDFDGSHQLHFIANGRTVTTRKIDGLLGIGRFGAADDCVYHGCVTGDFLNERVNQERTNFNFDETVIEEIAKACAEKARAGAIANEITSFERFRMANLEGFLNEYPSFQFDAPQELLKRTPKNAVKAEQFAQALIPTRIRRDEARKIRVQEVVATLAGGQSIPQDFAAAVRAAAQDVRAEEQRQLTEYVLRRKLVLDVMDVLIRRVREAQDGGDDDFHLEKTLHQFLCPMRVRGDDPTKIESADHDLWVIDERLAFSRYFASDVPFDQLIESSDSGERADLVMFDKIHGLGFKEDEPLRHVLLVEFKKPGRTTYDERYSPQNQISRYLGQLAGGQIESFDRERIRVASDCVFYCYVVADIVGNLDVHTSTWRTTSNGRGRWQELSGKYRGSIEIIEWKDLIADARARNRAFIEATSRRP